MDKGGEEGRKLKREEEKYRKVRGRKGVRYGKEVEETERMDCMHVVVDRYLV